MGGFTSQNYLGVKHLNIFLDNHANTRYNLLVKNEGGTKKMFQIRYDIGNRHEYSQNFDSTWAANMVAISAVRSCSQIIKAEIVNKVTGEIEKTYKRA